MLVNFNTPILLLIFNRPEITLQVFNQIKAVKPQYLYVAADGPRPGRPDDIIACSQTREIINQVGWPCEVKTLFRNENLGCGLAVSSAINWFFEQVEEGIILEDDCLPDVSFFPFCSELLTKYKEDKDVYLISGMNRQNGIMRGNASYYFSNYTVTWGWASWRRAWSKYSFDMPDAEEQFSNRNLDLAFQSVNEKKYWRNKIINLQTEKVKSTWDYQWRFAIWRNKGIGITPNVNLVINLGLRNSSTHTFLKDSRREPSAVLAVRFPLLHPPKIVDRIADLYTYKNAFSHSPTRIIRLINENGIISIIKYIFSMLLKK